MLDAAEAARRIELHQRAYAPAGSLTDAELAELHELDNRSLAALTPEIPHQAPAVVRGAQPVASVVEDADTGDLRADGAARDLDDAADGPATPPVASATEDAPAVDPAEEGDPHSKAPKLRRWLLPLVATLAVLVGLGAGWLIFGADRTTLTAAQQDTWSTLEASGEYDPGSIHLSGEKYGATTWLATQNDAERVCIILTRNDVGPSNNCRSATGDYQGFDLQASLNYTEDGEDFLLFAVLAEDAGGHPVTIIQQQNMTEGAWDWRSQYTEDELAQVDLFEEAGVDGRSLNLIGYDDVTPIWLSQDQQTCLMVVQSDSAVAQQCGSLSTDPGSPLQLVVNDAVYSVVDTNRGPSLTIIRAAASIVCDVDSGYCASADDTTGKIN